MLNKTIKRAKAQAAAHAAKAVRDRANTYGPFVRAAANDQKERDYVEIYLEELNKIASTLDHRATLVYALPNETETPKGGKPNATEEQSDGPAESGQESRARQGQS